MGTIKCTNCNLVNWASQTECKRCGLAFVNSAATAEQVMPVEIINEQVEHCAKPIDFIQAAVAPQSSRTDQTHVPPPYQYPVIHLKKGLAIASMVLGIVGIATSIILIGVLIAPVGFVLGLIALVKANKRPDLYGGKGLAVAGIATSASMLLFVPMIAAIAIPNFLAARRAANEGSAISSMRILSAAELNYMDYEKARSCGDLKTLSDGKYIDPVIAKGEKSGYRFQIISLPAGGCEINAIPVSSSTGDCSFYYATDDGYIRAGKKGGKPAGRDDEIVFYQDGRF